MHFPLFLNSLLILPQNMDLHMFMFNFCPKLEILMSQMGALPSVSLSLFACFIHRLGLLFWDWGLGPGIPGGWGLVPWCGYTAPMWLYCPDVADFLLFQMLPHFFLSCFLEKQPINEEWFLSEYIIGHRGAVVGLKGTQNISSIPSSQVLGDICGSKNESLEL